MSLTIRCDAVDDNFYRCTEELTGLAFDDWPESWLIVRSAYGDHYDYCPKHVASRQRT